MKEEIRMDEFDITVTKVSTASNVKITVVGVGGAGGNMINQLAKSEISDHIKMVSANTDAQALEDCIADEKILLGPNTTKGQGAGMDPELGKRAALESYEVIKEALKH